MKLLVALEAVDWDDRVVGHAENYRRNKFAAALRLIADRVQTGGTEGEIDAGELQGSYRLELPSSEPAADAA
jgi:hypothetical protein